MNNQELIKILRSSSNDIKSLIRNQWELAEILHENVNSHRDKRVKIKNIIYSIIIWNLYVVVAFMIKDNVTELELLSMSQDISLIALIMLKKYFNGLDKYNKDELNYDNCVNMIKNMERKISSSEYAIEFLNSITEDELKKYLGYKM